MTVHIYGIIGYDWRGEGNTEEKIRAQLAEEEGDEVVAAINSPGGSLFSGLALMNILRRHDAKIVVEVDGLAASAASVIAMGADEVRMPRGSFLMIHNATAVTWGDHHEMRDAADDLEKMTKEMIGIYARRTGKDKDEIRQMLDDETWLTAEEAVEQGFADTIIGEDHDEDTEALMAMKIAACDLSKFDKVPDEVARMASLGRRKIAAMKAVSPRQRGADMKTKKTGESTSASAKKITVDAPANIVARTTMATTDTSEDVLARARAESKAIRAACERAKLTAEQTLQVIDKAGGLSEAKDLIIDIKAAEDSPPTYTGVTGSITAGLDERDKFRAASVDAIQMRGGVKDHDAQNPMRRFSLIRLAEECVVRAGVRPAATDQEVIRQALNPQMVAGGHTTSDFKEILKDSVNKMMLRGYEEAPETWSLWCVTGSLTDFREAPLVGLNVFDSLKEVGENAEYEYGSIADRGERIQLGKYGRLIRISYETIINDDLNMLTRVPARMGRAAARVAGDLAYGVLIDNPEMNETSENLFSATHGNTHDDALDYDGLDAVSKSMETRVEKTEDGDDVTLGITPAKLIVPPQLRHTALSLMQSEVTGAANQVNTFRGMFDVISEHRLGADSAVKWYLTADPAQFDTVMVAFRDGNPLPFIDERDEFNVDGITLKVRQEAAAAPMDYRTLERGGA